ncbi:putative PurR-regulated permease PerM [Salsuginibacillus halophilus]|uniref:Putative PurR-regulated permease PerM n=1 Tax=Salsuginibacillus halophilus TaxID=517424 RepID=A0A2P8HFV2_9BACI|nr:AI-2E family transporter [Salsuginibacillus halophilus]PSL45091.1 putative PurR-regulated permease PerM [Salsuginibacillus halophilus]
MRDKFANMFSWLLLTAVALVILYILKLLAPWWQPLLVSVLKVLLPFLAAGVFAYLLHPVIDFLERRRVNRGIAVGLVYLSFLIAGGIVVFFGAPLIEREVDKAVEGWPALESQVQEGMKWVKAKAAEFPGGVDEALERHTEALQDQASNLVDEVFEHWRALVEGFIFFLLIPFIVFYLLKDIRAFEKSVEQLTPARFQGEAKKLVQAVDHALGGYIRGQLLVSLTVALLSGLALWIIGVPYAVVLAIIIGLFDLVPYVGPWLGAAPAVMVSGTVSLSTALWTIGALVVIQQLESNVLSPYIVGRSVHLHPLIILLALLFGFEFGGVVGLIVAVPLVVVIAEVIRVWQEPVNDSF